MSKELALAAKNRGNEAFSKGDFQTAITAFSEAIQHDPTDAVFYSNRSGAYASLKQFDQALADANKCVELKPDFIKGYSRQGVAHFGLNDLESAKKAYEAGLKIDPNATVLKDGLADIQKQSQSSKNPLGSLFGPDMWVKLQSNPVTREYLKDPSFVAKIQSLSTNPNAFGSLASDPKMSQALGVILGMGTEGFSAMGGAGAGGAGAGPSSRGPTSTTNGGATVEDDDDMVDSDDESPSGTVKDATKRSEPSKPPPQPQQPPKELTEEEKAELAEREAAAKAKAESDRAKAKVRGEADKSKNLGNDFYKKRDFPTAITHYSKAIEIDSTNIVYYTNLSAVYMEQKEYQKAIDTALKGIEVGKEHMANYTDLAKAFARIGSAYQSMGDLDHAIEYFNKSLVEDYTDKTKQQLKKVEEEKKKASEAAYIDPVKSEEHKEKGNELYKAGKFADAIGEYTESIKRNPQNYKVYSNRAACYTKMMDWGRGLEDCEKCIAMDPKFVKAYIRKGKIQHFLKQYHKALTTFDQASEIEPGNQEVLEAKRATMIAIQSSDSDPERAKEAMKDPEIQSILRDPTISKVLQDMQTSPQAGQAAMRDPDIRKKIERLIAAGVLSVK